MRLSDFKYPLPEKLIAQEPLKERDKSRLLVLDRASGQVEHRLFKDIVEFFGEHDVLVVNDTRVVKARMTGYKEKTDAEIEVFLLRELNENMWEIMVKPARKVRMGNTITLQEGITCDIIDNTTSGGRVVRVNYDGDFHKIIDKYGTVPLPPYIKRTPDKKDEKNYQTLFANEERVGAVAAPTAGLHFTKRLLGRLERKGVAVVPITLHVSLGTFRPVNVEDLTRHRMDSEHYIVTRETARAVNDRIKLGGKVWAVGTTVARTLETVARFNGGINPDKGWTDKFIYPPYEFKVVDRLITNFHLPSSTLLMLVSAFATRDQIMASYKAAIKEKYRFFSYGDAMLIR
ncbi:MAG: tRNA preQ1(34) S-adenosylmethionine ribosyltransferase-isomerase QueA [bacterium]|jgi:S-adenosylmethionine:tRNA ribosyltransferase-isomerase|nr:tRNA preQ1(34) S-adenosylmethionine ribosyltransferase-isomerase QueA [bacterium]